MQRALLPLILSAGLIACTEESMRPQPPQPVPEPAAAQAAPVKPKVVLIEHNLSRVADAQTVTKAQLDALQVGKTTKTEVTGLLGEIKPFTLGDGKQIYRYDVGKFIFDQQGVLIRKFINP